MNITATLLGQAITFAIFVWFTMKFIWPPIMKGLDDRRKKVAAGLAAAEQGELALEKAREEVDSKLTEMKRDAAKILEVAHQRSTHIIEEAKKQARTEGERLIAQAKEDISREYQQAKQELSQSVANIAVKGAEHLLRREIDQQSNDSLVAAIADEI